MSWTRFFRRRRWDEERAREIDAYIDIETSENIARGMMPQDARDAALRKLGNRTQIREEIYRMNTMTLVDSIQQDVGYALRQLRRAPGFTAAAVLSLALGIGANTAIFTLLDQVLLRPLPVKDADRLVLLNWEGPSYSINEGRDVLSYPMYRDIRDGNQVFSGVLARNQAPMGLGYNGQVERVTGEFVSGNYFDVLGVPAAVGRTLTQEDDNAPGAHPVAVLSYDYWLSRFRGDPGVPGSKITLNGVPFTIVGVSAKGFDSVELNSVPKIRILIAMRHQVTAAAWTDMFGLYNDGRWVTVFGRLRDGVTREQAKASLQPLFHASVDRELERAAAQHPIAFTADDARKAWMNVSPASEAYSEPRDNYGNPLRILMAIVGLVLLIACANVANLLLARAAGREREMAARIALGASVGRLIRQSLVESVMLAIAGGVSGLLIAAWTDRFLLSMLPTETGQVLNATPDPRVLAFALMISVLTGLLFGLAPALSSRKIDVSLALKEQARTMAGSHARFRRTLAFAQVFLSALLLMGAGLFVRSLRNLNSLDPGFRTENLLVFSLDPTLSGYSSKRRAALFHDALERLRITPGVENAGFGVIRLLENWWGSPLTIEGFEAPSDKAAWAVNNGVSPGYFAALGTPLIAGRDFSVADLPAGQKVAVVNETFARRFFADRSPLRRRFGYGSDPGTKPDIEIVGVVKDAKYGELREETMPEVFVDANQMPDVLTANFYVRTHLPPESMFPVIRRTMTSIDPNVPVFETRTMTDEVSENLSAPRMVATLASLFGALATFLAAVGLYGLLAFNVARRTREFGIRTALGASRSDVVWLVIREVLVLAGMGIALAIPAAYGLARLAQSQIYQVSAADPQVIAAAALLLATVACLAAYLPAARAMRIDPARALRCE
jgi:predicted permease